MNRVVHIAILASVLGVGPLHAQTTSVNVPVAAPPSVITAPIPETTATARTVAPSCELHVFPTKKMLAVNNLGGAGYLFGGGVVGALVGSSIHGGKRSSTEVLISELPSSAQIEALKNIFSLSSIIGMKDPRIIEEPELENEELPERSKAKLANSTAQCYAELVIWSVMFDGVGGPKLHLVTYFRNYVPETGKMSLHNEIQFGRLHLFPPKTPDGEMAAHAELTSVFSTVLEKSLRIMTGTD